mmetsp:Transcript_84148/g.149125  ORF Transcript_84148/g.149125 Transcript_84148/m.149125 type:complete len:670 (-) Transcript_84148:83-2092(-)
MAATVSEADISHLKDPPALDGPFAELSFGRLTAAVGWLVESVRILEQGLLSTHGCVGELIEKTSNAQDPYTEMPKRISKLESAQLQFRNSLKDSVEAIVAPMIEGLARPPSEKAPSEKEERPPTPPPPPTPPEPFDTSIITALRDEFDRMKGQMAKLREKMEEQEAREKNRKPVDVPDPFSEINNHLSEMGLLFEEGEGVVSLCKVLVGFKNDIRGRAEYKDLEDQKQELETRISEVEQAAADDAEARAQVAAEESRKLDERLVKVENTVQELVAKNEADGDVAGRLRGLTLRVDAIEEREEEAEALRREEELRRQLEEAKRRKQKGLTLEQLGQANIVDMQEEIRRLRAMIECMEATMPPETRQTLAFFKTGAPGAIEIGGAGENGGGSLYETKHGVQGAPANGGTLVKLIDAASPRSPLAKPSQGVKDPDLLAIRGQMDELMERHAAEQQREIQNMGQKMKVNERTLEVMDAKVDDMWRKLPNLFALLEPMQALMEQTEAAGSDAEKSVSFEPAAGEGKEATGPTGTGQAQMKELSSAIRTALKTSLEEIQSDIMAELHRLRSEFQNKANINEVLALSSRVDAWSQHYRNDSRARDRSISPVDSPSDLTASMKQRTRLPASSSAQFDVPVADKKKGLTLHEKCKKPTCPSVAKSQSESRLPALRSPQ